MKEWVARNKTVTVQILEQLAADVEPRVRHAVAMKNKLSKNLMLTLTAGENLLQQKTPEMKSSDSWPRMIDWNKV